VVKEFEIENFVKSCGEQVRKCQEREVIFYSISAD